MDKNFYIIGVKHCGKSTVGLLLSKQLKKPFFDLDNVIEDITNQPVRDFYKKYGKDKFQQKEYEALIKLKKENKDGFICATGGGICDNSIAVNEIKSQTVYIETPPETLYSRIIRGGIPAFLKSDDPEKEFYNLYEKRSGLYKNMATIIVDGSHKTPDEITKNILIKIEES